MTLFTLTSLERMNCLQCSVVRNRAFLNSHGRIQICQRGLERITLNAGVSIGSCLRWVQYSSGSRQSAVDARLAGASEDSVGATGVAPGRTTFRILLTTESMPSVERAATRPAKMGEKRPTSSCATSCQIGRMTFLPSTSRASKPSSSFCGHSFAKKAFETTSRQVVSELVFRTSPSSIFSGDFTHAVIKFPGKLVLEAHTGVYVSAKSKVRHECDVAVLQQGEADICRQNNVHPRFHKLVLSIECKFYASSLGINLARSFVGLLADIQSRERFFVANTSSDSVKTMLSFHNKNWACDIHPAQERNVRNLVAHFEAVFSRFKAAI